MHSKTYKSAVTVPMINGILTAWKPSPHNRCPNEYLPSSLCREQKNTLNFSFFVVELNDKIHGSTLTFVPGGASTWAMYTDSSGPTFVTVLDTAKLFFRLGMMMEGRLRFRRRFRFRFRFLGHGDLVIKWIAVVL